MGQVSTLTRLTSEALTADELRRMDAYWRACNYLCVGMLYLQANPLLREPLKPEHIKNRLLGHWGSDPGQNFTWVHLNRLIKKYALDLIYLSGPGHGAPATLSNSYLEGVYSEVYPDKSQDAAGCRSSSSSSPFPAGLAAIARRRRRAPSTRAASWLQPLARIRRCIRQSRPDCCGGGGRRRVGDGAAGHELALQQISDPVRDGAVLPILHLNGYKIANPTILARIPPEELEMLFKGWAIRRMWSRVTIRR